MNDKTLNWENKLSFEVILFNNNPSSYKDNLTDKQMIDVLNSYIGKLSGKGGIDYFRRSLLEMTHANKTQN